MLSQDETEQEFSKCKRFCKRPYDALQVEQHFWALVNISSTPLNLAQFKITRCNT